MNSAFPNKKNFAHKSKFIYDKQKANVSENSTFQVNRTKKATGKRRRTSGNRAVLSVLHWKNNRTNLFHTLGQ